MPLWGKKLFPKSQKEVFSCSWILYFVQESSEWVLQNFHIIPWKSFCHCKVLLNSNWLSNSLWSLSYFSLNCFFVIKIVFCPPPIGHLPLMTTKIPHDEWLALNDPKGLKMMIFLEPEPINIPLLGVRCPFILSYCTLQLNWLSMEIFTVDFIMLTLNKDYWSKELRTWLYSLLDGVCKTPDCIKSGKDKNTYF